MSDKKIEDMTEKEFLRLVKNIFRGSYNSESGLDRAIEEFVRLAEHPSETDLLSYPDPERPDTPEGVVAEVKAWRAANGKPGFKDSAG